MTDCPISTHLNVANLATKVLYADKRRGHVRELLLRDIYDDLLLSIEDCRLQRGTRGLVPTLELRYAFGAQVCQLVNFFVGMLRTSGGFR